MQWVIDSLDDRGRWVEQGRLRYQDPPRGTEPVIECPTFINNCRILSSYLATEPPK